MAIDLTSYDPDAVQPRLIFDDEFGTQTWAYIGTSVSINSSNALKAEQLHLEIKHAVMRYDKRFEKLRREVEAIENFDLADVARRERIPDKVQLFVWQRDQGKCVRCGSSEKLELDHVIAVVKGGSNTERNIQLLCEACNRSKGASI